MVKGVSPVDIKQFHLENNVAYMFRLCDTN